MRQKTNDWHVWGEWPGIPWFHSCYNAGLALELKRRSGVELSKFAAEYTDGVQRLYLLEHEWREGGAWYLQQCLKNPEKLERDVRVVERAADNLLALNKKLARVQPGRSSQKDLVSWYRKFHDSHHELWCAGMVPNLLELNQSYLSSYLRQYVFKHHPSLSQEQWQDLITPTTLSAAQEEERAFLDLVVRASRQVKLQALRALKRHHARYSWIQYGWTGPKTSFEYYLDLFTRFLRQADTAKRFKNVLKEDGRLARAQRTLEKRVVRDAKHRHLFALLRRILFAKAHRMDALYHGYATVEPLLREIGRRLGLSLNQVFSVYASEMLQILKTGKLDLQKLNAAEKHSAFVKEGGRLRFFVGEEARKKLAPIHRVLPKQKEVRELRGEIGYPGKVRGRVVRVDRREDMQKVKRGDILVSHVTDPSLLPAMEKVAAFVTDMGGLTAHAAIVAREMKKPCIVGTKMATRIFKDGDRVEVDAERGIVRKI